MSLAAEPIVGINWASTTFRACLIRADGTAIDAFTEPSGVVGLDRAEMAKIVGALARRWPEHGAVYAAGMIGSSLGWAEVPYAAAPAGPSELARAALATVIGEVPVRIVPGVACRRSDGQPDVLRGEEIELLGLATLTGRDGLVALPGAHTKWVWLTRGRIGAFFTSMSGEIYDRLTAQGLLASIVEGEARVGEAFHDGVVIGLARRSSLGTALFGARARVMCGDLGKANAASYLRGLLIGAEIGDARVLHPSRGDAPVPLIGDAALSALYADALAIGGIASETVDAGRARLAGFRALHQAAHG